MSLETHRPKKIPEYHFRYEWDVSPDDPAFLDAFLKFLSDKGYDQDQLVFSGFNGQPLVQGKELPKLDGIFAMNTAGWRQSYREGLSNPAHYADRWAGSGVPAIGLFDKNQLAEAYNHDMDHHSQNVVLTEEEGRKMFVGGTALHGWSPNEDEMDPVFEPASIAEFIEERTGFKNAVKGHDLADVPASRPVFEGVIHKNYPDSSPIEALKGVVYIEQSQPKSIRDHGF